MEIIPAIDVLNGRSVRLARGQGNPDGAGDDPVETARRFAAEGAGRLHIADLNGVLEGVPRHLELARTIREETGIPVQVAGGFRRIDRIEEAIRLGIDRVVLGQGAIESPALLEEACRRFGDRIALAVEIEGEQVVGHERSNVSTHLWRDVLALAMAQGLARLVVTNAGHDETEAGSFAWFGPVRSAWPRALIVAGGITTLDQLRSLAALEVGAPEAVVVGKALHEKRFGLREAQRTGGG